MILEESVCTKHIITVNADIAVRANKDENLRRIINNAYATLDGQIPYLLALLSKRKVEFEKISGSDFIYTVCEFSRTNNKRIFLLGGTPHANRAAIKALEERFCIKIKGYSPPFENWPFSIANEREIRRRLKVFRPDFIFVGFGCPKQEYWIDNAYDFLNEINVTCAIGSGGTFEFVGGVIGRAPLFVQKIGMEGFYRLMKEPSRMRLRRLVNSLGIFKLWFISVTGWKFRSDRGGDEVG